MRWPSAGPRSASVRKQTGRERERARDRVRERANMRGGEGRVRDWSTRRQRVGHALARPAGGVHHGCPRCAVSQCRAVRGPRSVGARRSGTSSPAEAGPPHTSVDRRPASTCEGGAARAS
jgi:hypothetical protein